MNFSTYCSGDEPASRVVRVDQEPDDEGGSDQEQHARNGRVRTLLNDEKLRTKKKSTKKNTVGRKIDSRITVAGEINIQEVTVAGKSISGLR